MSSSRPPKRPSKRPSAPPFSGGEPPIPPPPPTKPEGVGLVISPGDEAEPAESYYKAIHAHRTVLAMKAVRPDGPGPAEREDRQALLRRVFAAEKDAAVLRERLAETERERDAARGEVIALREKLRAAADALR